MPINLEDHIVVHSGIKFVPLTIAKKAVEEAYENSTTIDSAVEELFNSFTNIQKTIEDDNEDSPRES